MWPPDPVRAGGDEPDERADRSDRSSKLICARCRVTSFERVVATELYTHDERPWPRGRAQPRRSLAHPVLCSSLTFPALLLCSPSLCSTSQSECCSLTGRAAARGQWDWEHTNVVAELGNAAVVARLHKVIVECDKRPDLCPPELLAGLVH